MSKRLEDLDPDVRAKAEQLIAAAAAHGFPIRVTHTLRTWDEQGHIYAKGRSIPGEPCSHSDGVRKVGTCHQHPLGKTVTNAPPGFSWHNFGRAFDVCFAGKKKPYIGPWAELIALGKALKLQSGQGYGDSPHFQDRAGKTLAQMRLAAGIA